MPLSSQQQEKFNLVCSSIEEGMSLREACACKGAPSKRQFLRWLADDAEDGDLRHQYARAREEQADHYADEIVEIADDARNDWMERHGKDDAGWEANGEHIQRSKLRIDVRKWTAAKLRPKKYGERQDVNVAGALTVSVVDRYANPDPE